MATAAHSIWSMYGDIYTAGLTNQLSLTHNVDEADSTTFASGGWRERLSTTRSQEASMTTFLDEEELLGVDVPSPETDRYLLTCYRAPQAGDIFHAMPTLAQGRPVVGGSVGNLVQADLSFMSRNKYVVKGAGASTGGALQWTTATATGNGSGVNFGALSAGDTLWAWLLVDKATVSGTTPTLDVTIQRAALDSWGAPTTVYTFSQATDAANTHQNLSTVTGAQAETWYRAAYTIAGTTPSFRFFVGLGVTTVP